MQEYTISNKTRQELLDVFDNNHRIEIENFKIQKPSKDREVKYLEELKTNPNIPMPQNLIYRTMTGIEEQIKHASDNFPFGLYLEYEEPQPPDSEINNSIFHLKRFPIQRLNSNARTYNF